MPSMVKLFKGLFRPWVGRMPPGWKPHFARPRLEELEERWCPADVWTWASGANTSWGNMVGTNWKKNGIAVNPGDYPGKPNQQGDIVVFNDGATVNCTLDVPTVNLGELDIVGTYSRTLTLTFPLTVSGASGDFRLTAPATIAMTGSSVLNLYDLGPQNANNTNLWSIGVITGSANNALVVTGTTLPLQGTTFLGLPLNPGPLGTKMMIQSGGINRPGSVVLNNMTTNLTLNGTGNYIDVGMGGTLQLNQVIAANGQQNARGGIVLGGGNAGPQAVQVEVGGELDRNDGTPVQGVPDQVQIGGTVYNMGGSVIVSAGNMLDITGTDTNNISYWQTTSAAGSLKVDTNAVGSGNIEASGIFQIDSGTVKLTAESGSFADELDGAGLDFGNTNNTFLTITDSTVGTPGEVIIQGSVTLAQKTTTTLNFTGGNNTADLLEVSNGYLQLNGTLMLNSIDGQKPNQPLNFLADSWATPAIDGNFSLITDSFRGMNDTGAVVGVLNDPNLLYYQVTIQ
jgi:hypothetical protein